MPKRSVIHSSSRSGMRPILLVLGGSERLAQRLEAAAMVAAVALAVARPAFPSEDADQGTGLVVVGLWGVVAVLWAVAQMARGELRLYAGAVDGWAVFLLAIVCISVPHALALRPAINMAAEWAALVLSFLLIRQLFRTPSNQGMLIAAMFATAFALSAFGIQQSFWGLPALREEYERDPGTILKMVGIIPGSPQQQTFANRLRSPEPFATFALANSLAGFLVAWLPLGLGWSIERVTSGPSVSGSNSRFWKRVTWSVGAGAAAATAACLLLTQSRAAWGGLAVELMGLAVYYTVSFARRSGQRLAGLKLVGGVFLAVAVVIAIALSVAISLGKIDDKNLTEAGKSLGYRWQYWRATGRLIGDHFWIGVGPGNFQGHYLQYKLPESSEEITDPHNLVLEVWATSGAVAAAALVVLLGWAFIRMSLANPTPQHSNGPADWLSLTVFGAGGLGLAAFLSASGPFQYGGLLLAWFVASSALAAGAPRGWLRPPLFACAVAGLVLHMTASGGIGVPGVAQTLWLLLALGLNVAEGNREPARFLRQSAAAGTALAVVAALAAFGVWVLRPVTESQAETSVGRALAKNFDVAGARRHFLTAADLDPLAAEPWVELARSYYDPWRMPRQPLREEDFERAVQAMDKAVRRAPLRLEPHTELGGMFATRASDRPLLWDRAIDSYERCVAIYPTSASLGARLADALWRAGQHERAVKEMQRSLELDAQNPHPDKKLDPSDRETMQQRLGALDLGHSSRNLKAPAGQVE